MIKISFILSALFYCLSIFADSSIYENNSGSNNHESIYEGEYTERSKSSSEYLAKPLKFQNSGTDIESDDYGKKDMTGQSLSHDVVNLDEISMADSNKFIDKISKFNNYHAGISLYSMARVDSPIFKKIFENTQGASQVGTLVFSLDQRLMGGDFSLNYLTGLGISYFKGKGFFVDDNTESESALTLWLLPVDFGLAGSYSLGGYTRFLVGGGISGILAVQSRSDAADDEPDVFQFGYGPFFAGKFNVGLNKIFPKYGIDMFRNYGITNTYLNLEYRFQSYSQFKSNFSVEGSSIGFGVSFDFI